jgi:hypothetical protein
MSRDRENGGKRKTFMVINFEHHEIVKELADA